jgi:hypothetical protein
MTRFGPYQVFRPLVIGLVHGLAGSAAVALLVLSTIRTPLWAIAYLLIFGIGTIIGMMLMTSAMAIPVAYTGEHFEFVAKYLSPISGIARSVSEISDLMAPCRALLIRLATRNPMGIGFWFRELLCL